MVDKLDLEQEKDAVDIVTNSMFSLSFLSEITKIIFGPDKYNVSVGEFYDKWIEATKASETKIPYSLGSIIGYLYCGLLITKENWFDLLPDQEISALEDDWGLSGVTFDAPKCKKQNIRYLIRRIRNALGHSWFNFNFPPEKLTPENVHQKVSITFHDQDVRDNSDTFEVTLTLSQLQKLVQKLQSIVHTAIRVKK